MFEFESISRFTEVHILTAFGYTIPIPVYEMIYFCILSLLQPVFLILHIRS